ncbi:MAG: hypothetical protein CVU29_09450 [Betaproteobacteria bacterium HGW-Betaproteobacteria-22]|nr:MAG: hypothetical protein CVU29_09450 [Betaproteobacteria bacterium HGW-Betaproteobacteria-22]
MLKASTTKLILCATANHLLAGIWRAGKLLGNQTFEHNEAGHSAFAVFLQKNADIPLYLIADAVEEDYRLESLPHTTGAAKHELISRKLNQHYRGMNYRTARFINRDKDKRKDDNYLFVALSNDDFLHAWVEIIQAAEAQLVGVYLLPMLSQLLVERLKLTSPHMLLCEKLSSGLRQTYLHNGHLRMSRLVPSVPEEAGKLGYFYLVETEKTRLYLMSQRYITRDTPLNLVLASADGATQQISQGISQEQGIACVDVNLGALAKACGLSVSLIQQKPELLHMQLIANGMLVDNLAPDNLTKYFQFGKLKQAIGLASAFVGLVGLVAAGLVFKVGWDNKMALDQAMQDTVIQQHHYDEVAKDFPQTPISADDLRAAVEFNQTIASFPKSPRRVMQVVSKALEASDTAVLDNIQIHRVRWALTNNVNLKDQDRFIPVLSTGNTGQGGADDSLPPGGRLAEVAWVTAEIANFTGDYRKAINNVNQFVSNLKADSNVAKVTVLQEPVNVSSFVDLQGSTMDEQSTQRQPALFKLRIMLKSEEALSKPDADLAYVGGAQP